MHTALDIVLDALAEQERGTPTKRRGARATAPRMPKDVTPEEIEASERRLARAGYETPKRT